MKEIVLITGGTGKIGSYLASRFAEAGFQIALHYNHSEKQARLIQTDIQQSGGCCELYPVDFHEEKNARNLLQQIKNTLGHPTLIINSAAQFCRQSIEDTSIESLKSLFRSIFSFLLKSFDNTHYPKKLVLSSTFWIQKFQNKVAISHHTD